MTISKITRPYETLIRHNPDGTISAHHIEITEMVDDETGAIVAANPGSPVEIPTVNDVLNLLADFSVLATEEKKGIMARIFG